MQEELGSCGSLEQLQGLWTSPQFRAAFEQLPNDWKKLITERKDALKADLSKPNPNYVAPNFDGDRP
jgi:hypothetical protein